MLISQDFRHERLFINRIIHVFENLNLATPYKDWDNGGITIEEFKTRFKGIRTEMIVTFTINFIFTVCMMIPSICCGKSNSVDFLFLLHKIKTLLFSVNQIFLRHHFLKNIFTTKTMEDISYNNAIIYVTTVSVCIPFFCIMEVVCFFMYNYKVRSRRFVKPKPFPSPNSPPNPDKVLMNKKSCVLRQTLCM